jgi:hypothetical protein
LTPAGSPPEIPPVQHDPGAQEAPMADFARKHMRLIAELSKEAIIGDAAYDEYSKKGWFLYFWKEARAQSAFFSRSAQIVPFFNELFHLPVEWDKDPARLDANDDFENAANMLAYKNNVPAARRITALRPKKPFDDVLNDTLKALLLECLKVGFEKIPVRNVGGLGEVATPDLMFARHSLILDESHSYSVGWRGDTRSMVDLEKAGGFLSKAASDQKPASGAMSYAESINLRADWNPFKDPDIRSHYYYRKEQQDNCLHSVVSVTLDFVTASSFPKLEDLVGGWMKGQTIAPTATIDAPPDELKPHLCDVTIAGRKVKRLAAQNKLFLVVLFGGFFDTQKRQQSGSFPEVAVKQVPANNIVGVVSYIRVFHSLKESDGFTVIYDPMQSELPSRDKCKALSGDDAIGNRLWLQVYKQFSAVRNTMPFRACWTGTGGKKLENPLAITGSIKNAAGKYL